MATKFQADITQNVQPATADPSSMIRANQLKSSMLSQALGATEAGFKTYVGAELSAIEREAQNLPREALQKSEDAFAAKQQLIKNNEGLQEEISFMGPRTTEEEVAFESRVGGYLERARTLKKASEGGMDPAQYTQRVAVLTKQAIAKFPGLANEIRQSIGKATGMPYADDTAAMSYVRRMMGEQGGGGEDKTSAKFIQQEIETVAAKTGNSPADIAALRARGDPQFETLKNKAYERVALEQQVAQADLEVKAGYQEGGDRLKQALSLSLNVAGAEAAFNFAEWQTNPQNAQIFSRIEQSVKAGTLGVAGQNKAELDILQLQATTTINKSYKKAEDQLLAAYRLGTVSQTDFENNKKLIEEHKKRALGMFDGENLVGTAAILSNYRDKTIKEQTQQMELLTNTFAVFGDKTVAQRWFATLPDSRERRQIREDSPQLADILSQYEDAYKNSSALGASLLGSAPMLAVGQIVQEAASSPTPTPPIPISSTTSPATAKAALEAVKETASEVWKQLRSDNTSILTPQQVNTLSTMLNNGVEYNQPIMDIRAGLRDEAELFAKLPAKQQSVVKAALSSTIEDKSRKVVQRLNDLDSLFETKLQIGVRSDGTIGAVPPMNLLRSTVLSQGQMRRSDLYGVFNRYDVMKYRDIIPGKEEEFKRYERAAAEFEKTDMVAVNNMVLGRAVVNGEEAAAVGKDIATALNSRATLAGFFSNTPVATSTDKDLDRAISISKRLDPNVNEDFLRRAWAQASPAEKQKVVTALEGASE